MGEEMSCTHLLKAPRDWRAWRCAITGIEAEPDDCPECTGGCLPWLGLQVALGTVKVENLPPALQDAAASAARQAADPARLPASRERENAAVAAGLSPIEKVRARLGRRIPVPSKKKSEAAYRVWGNYTVEERAARGKGIGAGRKAENAKGHLAR